MSHNSMTQHRLRVLYEVVNPHPRGPFAGEPTHCSEASAEGVRDQDAAWAKACEEWLAGHLAHPPQNTSTQDRPHEGKCLCPPLTTPDAADAACLAELEAAAARVAAAEADRDRT